MKFRIIILLLLIVSPLSAQFMTETNPNEASNEIESVTDLEPSSLDQFQTFINDMNTSVSPADPQAQANTISNIVSSYLDGQNTTQEPETFFEKFRAAFRNNAPIANLLISILVVILIWLTRLIILKIVWKNTDRANVRYRWRKTSSYIALGLGIILISQIWIEEFSSILTYLGLVSAGIAIALKDFIVNLLGWVFIMSTKPFAVGDRIQIQETAGDVIDIRAFEFTILEIGNWVDADQSTGRIVHIPNGKIFTESLANYNKAFEFIWNEIPVIVTFDSDWQKAKGILQEIADSGVSEKAHKLAERRIREASKQFMIYYTNLTPTVYTAVADNGVILTVRYLCEPRERRSTTAKIWEAILISFRAEPDIEFAYNTVTVHKNGMTDIIP